MKNELHHIQELAGLDPERARSKTELLETIYAFVNETSEESLELFFETLFDTTDVPTTNKIVSMMKKCLKG